VARTGISVGGGGVGDGAEMNDRFELAAVEPADQFAGRHHVGELALPKVAPFVGVAERVVTTISVRPASLRRQPDWTL